MLQKSGIYLGACQTCMVEIIFENSKQLKVVNYFRKKSPSFMFDGILDTILALVEV